jgi:alpha-beta hydrolase superfamily lysophospholipase
VAQHRICHVEPQNVGMTDGPADSALEDAKPLAASVPDTSGAVPEVEPSPDAGPVPDAAPVREVEPVPDTAAESPIFQVPLDPEPAADESSRASTTAVLGDVEPAVAEPDVVESDVVESDVVESDVVESDVVEPAVVESDVVESDVVEPAVVEPTSAVDDTQPLAITPPAEHPAVDPAPQAAAIAATAVSAPEPAPEPAAAAMAPAAETVAPAQPVVAAPIPASHVAAKRRRWPWVTLLCVLLGLIVIAGAGLWYISGLIGAGMAVPQPADPFPLTVLAANDTSISYTGSPGGWDDQGLMSVATVEGGYVQTKSPSEVGQGATTTTTRQVTEQVLPPVPVEGQAATLDGWYFPRNPLVGLGVEYQDVLYPSPSGPTPAWFVPGTSTTWVIFTHGRAASPREGLRIASTVTKLGYPMLLIKYRDDPKAPAEDGYGNFGSREWPDLEAAVRYALDHGAQKVVLSGASMGGAITLAFLQNSALASSVSGAFLDSPATNFGAMVEAGATDMGLPGFVTAAAMQVASWRYGIDWSATDYTDLAPSLTTPTLIVQGTEDAKVPAKTTEAFAGAANPTTVQLEVFEGAGHVMSWNVDRARYDALLTEFLGKVAGPA